MRWSAASSFIWPETVRRASTKIPIDVVDTGMYSAGALRLVIRIVSNPKTPGQSEQRVERNTRMVGTPPPSNSEGIVSMEEPPVGMLARAGFGIPSLR